LIWGLVEVTKEDAELDWVEVVPEGRPFTKSFINGVKKVEAGLEASLNGDVSGEFWVEDWLRLGGTVDLNPKGGVEAGAPNLNQRKEPWSIPLGVVALKNKRNLRSPLPHEGLFIAASFNGTVFKRTAHDVNSILVGRPARITEIKEKNQYEA
jgi:hypothetical protein